MQTVFVSGATGFLGSYICRYLIDQGYSVVGLKRHTSSMQLVEDIHDRINWAVGDILDIPFLEETLSGVDAVIHAAAMISFKPSERETMMKVNVEGTSNMVNVCLALNISRFIQISSIAAIGRNKYQPKIDESISWGNSDLNSHYAISKFKSECEVWRGMEEGLNAAILNPSVIIGAGDWNSGSCLLVKQVADGLSFYPIGETGFVDVRDVARASIGLMESSIHGERYIVNGFNTSYRIFFQQMASRLGVNPPKREAKQWMLRSISYMLAFISVFTRKSPLVTKEIIRNVSSKFEYSNKKIIQDLAFTFTDSDVTIQQTADSYLQSSKQGKTYSVWKS